MSGASTTKQAELLLASLPSPVQRGPANTTLHLSNLLHNFKHCGTHLALVESTWHRDGQRGWLLSWLRSRLVSTHGAGGQELLDEIPVEACQAEQWAPSLAIWPRGELGGHLIGQLKAWSRKGIGQRWAKRM